MSNLYKILLASMLSGLIFSASVAQDNSVYKDMSLKEILNIDVVVTASKKPEDLFEAPLSTTIINKEDIANSGVTSIPEALRLSQGVIVREITPGNYDIHIRGYDDITKNVYVTLPYNTTTLVMIDNRIVYSYFSGGTFWETFPIDLNDVERIEVVRGPASALYGPNAVTGVINIITSHAHKKEWNVILDGIAGNKHFTKGMANIGYNWGDKTKLSISGNFTERYRFKDEYYNRKLDSYDSIEDLTMTLIAVKDKSTSEIWTFDEFQDQLGAWYDTEVSLRKMGGNLFFNHRFSEQTNMDLAMGIQKSQSQKTGFLNFATALSQINSKSYYVNARLKHKNLNSQFDVYSGQDLSNYKFNSYKFTNLDANIDYYKQFNKFSFRPGLYYKHCTYNSPITYDEPFSLTTLNYKFKDEPRHLISYAASLLSEWKPTVKLRIIGGLRMDKFNINKNYSYNHELGATYRLNKNNLIRIIYSKANRSPFIFDTYLNARFDLNKTYYNSSNEKPLNIPIDLNILSSNDLRFPTIKSFEFCWRTKITSELSLDLEMFYSTIDNVVVSNVYRKTQIIQQLDEFNNLDSIQSIEGIGDIRFENFDLQANQFGISFMIDYNSGEKLSAQLYATFQNTNLTGRTEIEYNTTNINITEDTEARQTIVSTTSFTNPTQWSPKLTPSLFGGCYVNFKLNKNWNFNTNSYFYSEQEFVNYDYNNIMADYTGEYHYKSVKINPNIILNAKVAYKITKNLKASFTLKNILGSYREYGFADQIGRLFLLGIKWEL